ncbi:MAG: hypothetical protein SFU91_13425 [Chloroherpetonaceae bacterium]|nr:hypothetical protein [Chloroherpetonaceae bacterium]
MVEPVETTVHEPNTFTPSFRLVRNLKGTKQKSMSFRAKREISAAPHTTKRGG